MTRVITKNIGWKLLSVLVAFLLWVSVTREPELATSVSVPVEFKNVPDDLDISSGLPDRVHIEVRGPSGRLSRDYLSDLAVILDMSDARPGERTFTINNWNLNLPAGLEFYRAVPSQITLRFDRLSTKDVNVIPRYLNPPPQGYKVQAVTVDPSRIKVRGPEDHLKNLRDVKTDPIDLSNTFADSDFRVHVNLGDPQIRLESPPEIKVHVKLEKEASIGS